MEINDPLRREEKKESTPDRKDSGPSKPDVNRPGRDDLLNRMNKFYPIHSLQYNQRTFQCSINRFIIVIFRPFFSIFCFFQFIPCPNPLLV